MGSVGPRRASACSVASWRSAAEWGWRLVGERLAAAMDGQRGLQWFAEARACAVSGLGVALAAGMASRP